MKSEKTTAKQAASIAKLRKANRKCNEALYGELKKRVVMADAARRSGGVLRNGIITR